ncbi:MAG: AAA family ATPase [Clostridia bacterium]|jgi:MoxR-like ATPase|nr:AAA family ATPase [Clostridia bacterium]MDH7573501.1 AAA family ATPase [Clostridia bacterium]
MEPAIEAERETQVLESFKARFEAVVGEVEKQVVGQREIVEQVLIAIVAGGNVLVEGAPGLGKTVLVKSFARVLDLPFSRIQFTPDLMPADIIGTEVVNRTERGLEFTFRPGPLFGSLVLADEINRASPKTQSALLEAMQEGAVTVGGVTYRLPEPFFVLATQNPIEMEGTYRLPEAQLDRFLFKLQVRLPGERDIHRILDVTTIGGDGLRLQKRLSREELLLMKDLAGRVPVPSTARQKAVQIVLQTHPDRTDVPLVREYVRYGASPRGVQAMIASARVRALAQGRFNVSVEDVREMALPCLRHRFFLNFKAVADGVEGDAIIRDILKRLG